MSVLHLNNDTFQQTISENQLVLVDFWATWCGPCKMIAPIIEELATEFDGKAIVAKVDVDQAGVIAQQFGIMSIPTIVLLKDGKEVERQVGVKSKETLADMVNKYL